MQKIFNLNRFLKKAFYDDVRGYATRNQRCFENCIKLKINKDKLTRQEAYDSCIKEYNTMEKEKWVQLYAKCYADSFENDNLTPAAKEIKNKK